MTHNELAEWRARNGGKPSQPYSPTNPYSFEVDCQVCDTSTKHRVGIGGGNWACIQCWDIAGHIVAARSGGYAGPRFHRRPRVIDL